MTEPIGKSKNNYNLGRIYLEIEIPNYDIPNYIYNDLLVIVKSSKENYFLNGKIIVSEKEKYNKPEILNDVIITKKDGEKIIVDKNKIRAIGDLAEIVTDLTGYYTDGKIMTGNAKKLADKIRKNPDILIDYTAHSQGTITSANAIIDIINSGDGDILKGKKIRFNGSPLQLDKMEKLSKEYGFEFEHVDNMRDPITNIIGTNKPNSENEGHSTSGNESNKGYSKYQKYNKNEKIYKTEVSDKDFHNVDEIRKVNGKDTNSKTSQKLKEIKNKIFDKKEGKK